MIRFGLAMLAASAAFAEGLCFGFLNAHPERKEIPNEEAQLIQKAHLAHMNNMAMAGHLIAAGPFATPGGPRGVVVYRCDSIAQATEWTSPDPAVQNKRLSIEMYRWDGPADFGEPLASQLKKDPNAKYEMVKLPLVIYRKTDRWKSAKPTLSHAKLRAGGPFAGGPPQSLGVYVFSAMALEDAKAIAEADPSVKSGEARVEAYVWFVANTSVPGATTGAKP